MSRENGRQAATPVPPWGNSSTTVVVLQYSHGGTEVVLYGLLDSIELITSLWGEYQWLPMPYVGGMIKESM